MEKVLELKNVSKQFGKFQALEDVSMTIHRGDIYGLIGRNGAGKTTILKIIVQLIEESQGTVQLFGASGEKEYLKSLSRTGSVIEVPVAYEQLTAQENLEYYCKLRGLTDKNAISRVLEMVDLQNTGKKKFKQFSLGMKQKMGLALALLSNPDFLILDEPTNGLDPVAIVEFRDLLVRLNREHDITILISSHILEELYHISTRFGFIDQGRLIQEITKEEFEEISQEFIRVRVDQVQEAVRILNVMDINQLKVVDQHTIHIYDLSHQSAEINRQLVLAKVAVSEIDQKGKNLEDYFTSLLDEKGGMHHD